MNLHYYWTCFQFFQKYPFILVFFNRVSFQTSSNKKPIELRDHQSSSGAIGSHFLAHPCLYSSCISEHQSDAIQLFLFDYYQNQDHTHSMALIFKILFGWKSWYFRFWVATRNFFVIHIKDSELYLRYISQSI